MNIVKITLLVERHSPDIALLHTDLPTSMPYATKQSPTLKLEIAAGSGEVYLNENFPNIPVEKIRV